jgi:hypothetical protein
MRKKVVMLFGLVAVFGLSTMIAGCSSKPSCKLLYKRYKDCKKMPLTEEAFVSMCEKLKDKGSTKAEIKCSAKSDCDAFKKCVKAADKARRVERRKKSWTKAMEKAAKGDYGRAMSFCNMWKDELEGDLKDKCKVLPVKATAALMKDIAAKRDAGKVSYKEVKCYDLKRYAKKAGAPALKKADTLCKEIALARDVNRVKESVAKALKKPSPFMPYQCNEKNLVKYGKLGTPYAKKAVSIMVQECYRKLGLYILQKKVPKMKSFCWFKKLYHGIKRYKITGPKIDELMKKAAEKCEKK